LVTVRVIWLDYPSNITLAEALCLVFRSREACIVSALVAVGAVCRIGLGQVALGAPIPLYGILVKVGLTETLAFASGFVFGPALGFLTGALIIVISDLFMMPGPWTIFIAAIIGILGVGGGAIRRLSGNPSVVALGVSAAVLTVLSEFLQNAWFALFFNIPIVAALTMGIPSLVTAVANNVILLTTVGMKTIELIQKLTTRSSGPRDQRVGCTQQR
jgi:uncharacterized membrane protein